MMTTLDERGVRDTRREPTAKRARLAARMVVSRARGRPHTLSHLVTQGCNGSR